MSANKQNLKLLWKVFYFVCVLSFVFLFFSSDDATEIGPPRYVTRDEFEQRMLEMERKITKRLMKKLSNRPGHASEEVSHEVVDMYNGHTEEDLTRQARHSVTPYINF